jgi:hypothetical protein
MHEDSRIESPVAKLVNNGAETALPALSVIIPEDAIDQWVTFDDFPRVPPQQHRERCVREGGAKAGEQWKGEQDVSQPVGADEQYPADVSGRRRNGRHRQGAPWSSTIVSISGKGDAKSIFLLLVRRRRRHGSVLPFEMEGADPLPLLLKDEDRGVDVLRIASALLDRLQCPVLLADAVIHVTEENRPDGVDGKRVGIEDLVPAGGEEYPGQIEAGEESDPGMAAPVEDRVHRAPLPSAGAPPVR